MPGSSVPTKTAPADVKREMLEAAGCIKRRSRELERARAKLRKDRDRAILRAVKGGKPLADVGEAFGLSQQRVSQIVNARRDP